MNQGNENENVAQQPLTDSTAESSTSANASATPPRAEKVEFTIEEWEEELKKAEQCGFKRGLNSRISAEMAKPGMLENPTCPDDADTLQERGSMSDSGFLSYIRPSVWD